MSETRIKDYREQLHDHLEERPYRPETIAYLGRVCRVGMVSEEQVLGILEAVERDHLATDAEMRGMEWDATAFLEGDGHGSY